MAKITLDWDKYIEKSREELVAGIREEDKHLLIEIFMENVDLLMEQIRKGDKSKEKVLLLSEPLCDLETRERLFKDIIREYAPTAEVFIKPHPRDVLDYKNKFKEQIVIEGKFPMEIMNFIPGIRWNKVISVFTVPDSIKNADEIISAVEELAANMVKIQSKVSGLNVSSTNMDSYESEGHKYAASTERLRVTLNEKGSRVKFTPQQEERFIQVLQNMYNSVPQ